MSIRGGISPSVIRETASGIGTRRQRCAVDDSGYFFSFSDIGTIALETKVNADRFWLVESHISFALVHTTVNRDRSIHYRRLSVGLNRDSMRILDTIS